MTIKEALQGMITVEVDDFLIEKALTDAELSGNKEYSADDRENVELCYAELLLFLATSSDISEGSLSIKYKPSQLLAMREKILVRWGLKEGSNITGVELW